MTDLEKLKVRLQAATDALEFVRECAVTDRKMSHERGVNGHYTKALTELESVRTQLSVLVTRMETIGR